MRNVGKTLTREVLISHAWGDMQGRDAGQVDVYIRRLRLKIEAEPDSQFSLTRKAARLLIAAVEKLASRHMYLITCTSIRLPQS